MAASNSKPTVSRDDELLRASYHFPHLLYTAKVYPVASPNGSTIIVYGHTTGIRVLWSGGKPFKPSTPEPQKEQPQAKDAQNDVVMILDSDDEEPPAKPEAEFTDEPQFEEEQEETDLGNPFPTTIQHLDLTFGTAVLHISFPPLPSSPSSVARASAPLTSQRMIMAIACSDHTVRVVTLPLMPPSPAKKRFEESRVQTRLAFPGDGTWREQILSLGGPQGHEDVSAALSITLTPRSSPTESRTVDVGGVVQPGATITFKNQKQDSTTPDNISDGDRQEWDVLVASVSSESSGILSIYRIPIQSTSPTPRLATDHTMPIHTEYLPSPALTIFFNPSPPSSKRHSHLLVADSAGYMRLYDCLSNGSNSSSDRQTPIDPGMASAPGAWLITLHLGYENLRVRDSRGVEMTAHVTKAKRFLDAKWVLGGKAILVLLSTGEWGIWDVEGAGPAADKAGSSKGLVHNRVIQGGAKTRWNLYGRIEGSMPAPQLSRGSSKKNEGPVKFAPRTPRTRKVEEQIFFGGNSMGSIGSARGRIAVRPSAMATSWRAGSETVAFWFAGVLAIIPDLWSFWENQLAKTMNGGIGNLLDSDGQGRMIRFDGVQVREETICDVDIFPGAMEIPSTQTVDRQTGLGSTSGLKSSNNLLISGGHHMVILSGRQSEPEGDLEASFQPSGTGLQMTVTGEMGLDTIDQALTEMDRRGKRRLGGVTKKVGFVGVS
ncbi:MAG: hypothetical protein M1816_005563 [Peltula sp. TS41687]|nr:MAG: hypothetical protein M1816_005563 [Peltula sp. TS41687]